MKQNLSYYYIFYVVAKNKNISSASKELFISQPAVSKSINKLEDNLNTKLLIRTSRGVSLTNEGKILYHRLSDAFHSIELGEQQLKYESEKEIEHLTIGASTTLCKYVLLPYLKEFVRQNPNIRISIACQPTHETLIALGENKIDIGLIGETDIPNTCSFRPIGHIKDIFVTTQNYLDNLYIQTGLEYKDLSNIETLLNQSTLMLLEKNNLSRHYIDTYLEANNIKPDNLIEVSNMDLLIEFATIGLGIACVIKDFVKKELKDGTLIELPIPFNIPKRTIGLAYRKNMYASSVIKNFLSDIVK